jgi:hypothetical protein
MPRPAHDGCAYSEVAKCKKRDCRPAELCGGGHRVYRDWNGGGHHHAEVKR